jgi:hypothetical protein
MGLSMIAPPLVSTHIQINQGLQNDRSFLLPGNGFVV